MVDLGSFLRQKQKSDCKKSGTPSVYNHYPPPRPALKQFQNFQTGSKLYKSKSQILFEPEAALSSTPIAKY